MIKAASTTMAATVITFSLMVINWYGKTTKY